MVNRCVACRRSDVGVELIVITLPRGDLELVADPHEEGLGGELVALEVALLGLDVGEPLVALVEPPVDRVEGGRSAVRTQLSAKLSHARFDLVRALTAEPCPGPAERVAPHVSARVPDER